MVADAGSKSYYLHIDETGQFYRGSFSVYYSRENSRSTSRKRKAIHTHNWRPVRTYRKSSY